MGFAKDADDTECHDVIWENGRTPSVLICMAPGEQWKCASK